MQQVAGLEHGDDRALRVVVVLLGHDRFVDGRVERQSGRGRHLLECNLHDVPWDREIQPSLDEVLEVRAQRRALVHGVLDGLTTEELDRVVSPIANGHPPETVPVRTCLRVVLNEEWEHRLYAERDLNVIEQEG